MNKAEIFDKINNLLRNESKENLLVDIFSYFDTDELEGFLYFLIDERES